MISYKGTYKEVIKKIYDLEQDHIFTYWKELSDLEKESFLKELSNLDFKSLEQKKYSPLSNEFRPAPFTPLPVNSEDLIIHKEAQILGEFYLKKGKVAPLVVAGGQGTRLGFSGPKGAFPINFRAGRTLFEIQAKKIKASMKKYQTFFPWLIMTSPLNHQETVSFFQKENFFGLNPSEVFIFPQQMSPSLDQKGKFLLKTKNSLCLNPDGHGGIFGALFISGTMEFLQEKGIETISYFQIDNPLAKIIDPIFIGFHLKSKAEISSKIVKKKKANEKVGVFVEFKDKSLGVVEYSDLSQEKINLCNDKGELLFVAANIGIHLFEVSFVGKIISDPNLALPYHQAQKKVKALIKGKETNILACKKEKFIFDSFPFGRNFILETSREKEFAPIKNLEGVDSVESARKIMDVND